MTNFTLGKHSGPSEEVMLYAKKIKDKAAVLKLLASARWHSQLFFPYRDRRINETEVAASCLQTFAMAISLVQEPELEKYLTRVQ